MADHDDARGTLTDDPVESSDAAEDNAPLDTSTDKPAAKARVVRRKPARLGALKRSIARPVMTPSSRPRGRLARLLAPRALAIVLVAVVAAALCVTAVVQWRGLQDEQGALSERQAFLQAGRQGALNLTTIRWDNADSDVQRILDGAADPFRKDFADRSKSFIAVVKEAKSTSTGEITEAGIASVDANIAQVVVSATVKTSNVGAAEQEPRAWRMKVTVEEKDNRMLVTNVEFVP
jgi:Mce-associated membrane protein